MQNQNTNLSEYDIKRMYDRGEIQVMESTRFKKLELQKIALQYKENDMRDNNCKANHDRGLEKRIANYATQHTINTMPNSPAKVHLAVKRAFYGNVLKALKLV